MQIDEMEAGRELDALVAEKVMELRRVEEGNVYFWPSPEMVEQIRKRHPDVIGVDYFPAPHYSTDIAAAWQVVDKLTDENEPFPRFCIFWHKELEWGAEFQMTQELFPHRVYADTAALAICQAALKAMEQVCNAHA